MIAENFGDYSNDAVAPPLWKSGNWLNDYFRRLDELHIEKELHLREVIDSLRAQLEIVKGSFDSPEHISALRNRMHDYRRQCDELITKLKEAEAFIEQQKQANDGQTEIIKELMQRCRELENPQPPIE
jgi:chromosome segregation ATPase